MSRRFLRPVLLTTAAVLLLVSPEVLMSKMDQRLANLNRGTSTVPPCVALATIGLARHRGIVSPSEENQMIAHALRGWAQSKKE